MKERKTCALVRLVAALVLAVILLGAAGSAVKALFRGPAPVEEADQLSDGAYVQTEVVFIMDVIGVEKTSGGRETAYYAVSPVGNTFVVVRYPAADFENAKALAAATQRFLQGEAMMEFFMTVTGTVAPIEEEVGSLLIQWFEENADWMIASGVIGEMEDYSAYLCPMVIQSGQVGRVSQGIGVALMLLAALLVVYAIVEAVLLGRGVYDRRPEKKAKPSKAVPEKAPVEKEAGDA